MRYPDSVEDTQAKTIARMADKMKLCAARLRDRAEWFAHRDETKELMLDLAQVLDPK